MSVLSKFTMERAEAVRLLARHFDGKAKEAFTAAEGLEYLRLQDFNNKPIAGTVFEEMNTVLRSLGHGPVRTFGDLTQAFNLDQRDVHKIGCSCNGEVVTGSEVASRLRMLAT